MFYCINSGDKKMLNLFKEKINSTPYLHNKGEKQNKSNKHFPSPIREWANSIYAFNKNSVNLIPSTTNLVNKLIKSYFNLYNKRLEYKMRTKLLKHRIRRLSSNKFFISSGGFKHTNNKVYINLFVFNRQKTNYLLTLKKWYLKSFFLYDSDLKKNNKVIISPKANFKQKGKKLQKNLSIKLIKRLNIIKHKGIQTVISVSKDKYSLIKGLNTVFISNKYKINGFKSFTEYTKGFYQKLIRKSLKKIRMYYYYKQLLYINKSKMNYTYLQYLKKQLENVYKKNVEFNIINLKKFYLNSDILSESITAKISKSRRKLIRYMNNLKNKIKVQKKKVFLGFKEKSNYEMKNFVFFRNESIKQSKQVYLQKHILDNLKYRDITGFRLEAKGRLRKRNTASRSSYKEKHEGGIYDLDSSFRGLSSVLLKGNLKSNTQYTKLKSKTRVGSFGIKGWVSGN